MDFQYSDAPQRSPLWFDIRRGRVTSSRLSDWLAVSKAKNSVGKPLKPRLDYEKELMFERQFGVSYQNYTSSAMQDGIDFEDFARKQYERISNVKVLEVGCWYNDHFVASPDGAVDKDGLVEIKVVRDNTFTDVLINGVPDKHYKQIQGQLWASSRNWCDYVCVNLNTKKLVIIRVEPDKEMIEYLAESVQEELVTEKFALTNVHELEGQIPSWDDENNKPQGDSTWSD